MENIGLIFDLAEGIKQLHIYPEVVGNELNDNLTINGITVIYDDITNLFQPQLSRRVVYLSNGIRCEMEWDHNSVGTDIFYDRIDGEFRGLPLSGVKGLTIINAGNITTKTQTQTRTGTKIEGDISVACVVPKYRFSSDETIHLYMGNNLPWGKNQTCNKEIPNLLRLELTMCGRKITRVTPMDDDADGGGGVFAVCTTSIFTNMIPIIIEYDYYYNSENRRTAIRNTGYIATLWINLPKLLASESVEKYRSNEFEPRVIEVNLDRAGVDNIFDYMRRESTSQPAYFLDTVGAGRAYTDRHLPAELFWHHVYYVESVYDKGMIRPLKKRLDRCMPVVFADIVVRYLTRISSLGRK